jgi:hypothetical protein
MSLRAINTEEFASKFAGGGLFGYCLIVSRFLLVYLIATTNKKRIITNLCILAIVVFGLLYQVKGWLLIPLIAGLMIRFLTGSRQKISKAALKKGGVVAFIGIFFFALSYYISLGPDVPTSFIFVHFFHYLWSGIIGLSEYLNSNVPIGELTSQIFNPINNVFNKIMGNEVDSVINPYFFSTYIPYHKGSNVTTFFGSILVSSGVIRAVLITSIFSFISYGVFIAFLKKKNVFNLSLHAFFLTALFFGWFNFYFQHLMFYVIIIVVVMLNMLFLFRKNKIALQNGY